MATPLGLIGVCRRFTNFHQDNLHQKNQVYPLILSGAKKIWLELPATIAPRSTHITPDILLLSSTVGGELRRPRRVPRYREKPGRLYGSARKTVAPCTRSWVTGYLSTSAPTATAFG